MIFLFFHIRACSLNVTELNFVIHLRFKTLYPVCGAAGRLGAAASLLPFVRCRLVSPCPASTQQPPPGRGLGPSPAPGYEPPANTRTPLQLGTSH